MPQTDISQLERKMNLPELIFNVLKLHRRSLYTSFSFSFFFFFFGVGGGGLNHKLIGSYAYA